MSKELVISAAAHETRVAIVEDGQLCEIYIEREKEFALVGSLYKGRVTRVLPGMQSSFVDIGLDSDAFLYVSDFLENLEDYDHVAPAADKIQKPAAPPGEVFAPSTYGGGVPDDSANRTGGEPGNDAYANGPAEAGQSGDHTGDSGIENADPASMAPRDYDPGAQPAQPHSHTPPVNRPASGYSDQRNQRPPFQGNRQGQGRGGFNNSGGRGGRGGRGRWGRQGGGGRDRRPGRDLPQSKYASPTSTPGTQDSTPFEPLPADYVPIILPGESLAKYKDRIPSSTATPPTSKLLDELAEPATPATDAMVNKTDIELPGSLYAPKPAGGPESPSAEIESSMEEHLVLESGGATAEAETTNAARGAESTSVPTRSSELEADLETTRDMEPGFVARESEPEASEHAELSSHIGSALSEDEIASFSEQLAEAKHEEAQAEAEDREEAEELAAAPFVEQAELEELQDALHEDETDDAEATADEMHDEALAAEEHLGEHLDASGEAHGEELAAQSDDEHDEHGEAHDEVHEEDQGEGNLAESGATGAQPSPNAQPINARISDQPRARFQRPVRRGGWRPRGGRRPGGRPQDNRPHSSQHQQHKRPQLISEMLKAGQEIIVQIAKEPLGKKGARITSHVALPGRFLVYMPTVDHIGVSHRIGSAEDRSRLRRLVTAAKGTFPGGFIVRTAAAGATDEEIQTDVEFLGRTWDTIRANAEQRHAPSLLHRDLNLVERILRDYMSDDYAAIWIDNEEEFSKVVEFVGRFQPKMVGRVKLYTKESPIFEEFGIQQELDKALRPKVWLKSGGYIVINHTEALVAIDVNTGKYVGRGSTRLEDTIVKTNVEAVKEIVRQIRLRDLGGIIVVDFIDMEERRNREKVLSALEQALSQDRAPSKALAFNEFGLVCITRKRTKQALERVLCQPCPYCTGSGMVKSIPTICYEIQAEARKMSPDIDAKSLTLRVNPEIAKALKTRESSLIEELEQNTKKSIIIQSDPTLHWEQYDIY